MTRTSKSSFDLSYILVPMFILPFFFVMPAWYITMEQIAVICMIVLAGVTSLIMIMAITGSRGITTNQTSPVKMFTPARIFAWAISVLIIVSLAIQDMPTLAFLYTIAVLLTNIFVNELMRKYR